MVDGRFAIVDRKGSFNNQAKLWNNDDIISESKKVIVVMKLDFDI